MTASLTPHTISPIETPNSPGTGVSNERLFYLSDLLSPLVIRPSSAALVRFGIRDRAYIAVSMAVYILSNNFVGPCFDLLSSDHRSFFESLDSTFREMPARHLRAILQSHLDSVRAAFEAWLIVSGKLEQSFAFKSLVEIGIENNWLSISARGHEYLYYAVCMGLDGIVQKLLESGCRPNKVVFDSTVVDDTTAIIGALERQNIECVQLLLQHCDVNSQVQIESQPPITSFAFFIEHTWHFDETLRGQGISLFLDAGADINNLLSNSRSSHQGWALLWPGWEENRTWSVLDYLFCFHPCLFYRFAQNWSPEQDSQPTRAGILISLEFGPSALKEYCERLAQDVGWACLHEYLELLAAEQLIGVGPWTEGPRSVVDLKRVRTLVDFGVGMDRVLSRAPCLLSEYMYGTWKIRGGNCDSEVIQYLLDNRAVVDGHAIQAAVRLRNTDLLTLLIHNTIDIQQQQQQGAEAVVKAAIANDFEAVKILLDAGVDVNTDCEPGPYAQSWEETASLLGRVVKLWTLPFEDLKIMINFLFQRGANFRLSAMKTRLSDMIEYMLKSDKRSDRCACLSRKVQYIIDADYGLSDPDFPSARLLEACGFRGIFRGNDLERIEIFETIVRNGALLRPGAPLAAWIVIGGGAELANEMLFCGVDIDAYFQDGFHARTALQAAAERCSEGLVALLLQNGADVNAPARGKRGRTALQAICSCIPEPAERKQQIRIINLLLAYGAKINAAPARYAGGTAVQLAAQQGDLEITLLLLSYDPPADVNAPPCQFPHSQYSYSNALDLAAQDGRLDVVKLLLNNNALSGCPGDTGYDGAIQAAQYAGRLAVADLIRQHATASLASNTTRISLSQPQRDWLEYGYDDYSDGYTTLDEDEDDEDEDYEDYESAESREEQISVAQVQMQPEHTALEPGWVSDMETDNAIDFDIGFGNLADCMGSIYGLDAVPTTDIDIATSVWGLGQ